MNGDDHPARPPPHGAAWHVCSYCNKVYPNLQALGGHQTAHRKEIEEMRRQHEARVQESKQQRRAAAAAAAAAQTADEERSVNLELTLGTGVGGPDLKLRL
ncbi:hypothetical protein AXF42_Ash015327 [Apostasia shenzhenica]|uniref:C2H2-type domain-containing protein n=1 Tax=Apostasia shenzhenica TaxID=1088818 RepID=A0A2I0ALY6_9ASPA|nr:hypothetical protein AXF42_Ash015327 [Apostasia shenzhenica]